MDTGTESMARVRKNRIFNLDPLENKMPGPMGSLVKRPLEQLLALPGINGIYDRVTSSAVTASEFCDKCLEDMDVAVRISKEDMDRIPRTGPLVVVANHPFGGVEGLILSSVLLKVRPDYKVMVNYLLGLIPEMRPICVFVDPFGTNLQQNVKGLKECLGLLRNGGCLGVFPSGSVSHLHLATRTIEDPKWSQHIGGLIRRTGAAVLPIYFEGNNGPVFQIAGLIHPRLRTALLPRATLNTRHKACNLQIGRVISAREISSFKQDQEVADFLRNRTYALAERCGEKPPLARRFLAAIGLNRPLKHAAIAQPIDPMRIERELTSLPPEQLLAQAGDLRCYITSMRQAPQTLQEVGRLRELTFRAIGEGTGKAIDLDQFDKNYQHLLVYNASKRELVGGYRLGLSDELVTRYGNTGLYVHTLFDLPENFLLQLEPAIELGRSFVRPDYQRSFSPLMLLWKGIGGFIARNPRYRYLFGPVSISNSYTPLSRALINEFVHRPGVMHDMASQIKSRMPFKVSKALLRSLPILSEPIKELEDLNDLVCDIEPDGKAVPILLKQYIKLGARTLGTNVDPDFGQCLDCLCMLDLLHADLRYVERYMGKEQVASYMAAHGESAAI